MYRDTVALLFLALLGCAHRPGAGSAGPPEVQASAGRLSPVHGRRPFLFPLRDGRTGEALPLASLLARMEAARVVYVGERHNDAASHDAQLAVLSRLYALDRDIALGVEMLPSSMQPYLDGYLAGRLDEEAFKQAVNWDETWGFDFALYRPLFSFCRAHRMRIYALNAQRRLVQGVRLHGVDGLSEELRRDLPDGYPWPQPEPHREYLREVFEQHPDLDGQERGSKDKAAQDDAFRRFYQAQLVWDETMAQQVARILNAPGAPRRLMVMAGSGHVGPYAIPQRAARRGIQPYVTLAPIEHRHSPPPMGARQVDILMVVGVDES